MRDRIEVNGVPCCIVVAYECKEYLGVKGSEYVGTFHCMNDLNKNLEGIYAGKPDGWKVKLSFADDTTEKEVGIES